MPVNNLWTGIFWKHFVGCLFLWYDIYDMTQTEKGNTSGVHDYFLMFNITVVINVSLFSVIILTTFKRYFPYADLSSEKVS